MEPLPKERGHPYSKGADSGLVMGLYGAAPEGAGSPVCASCSNGDTIRPQWSRSRRSGVTVKVFRVTAKRLMPQWSRSRRSGLNGAAPEGAGSLVQDLLAPLLGKKPQWSRSRRSGVTLCRSRTNGDPEFASMEPLPKERGHVGG